MQSISSVGKLSAQRLTGKVVIVTGAGKGIGSAISVRCAAEGAQVVLVDRDQSGLDATTKLIANAVAEPEQTSTVAGDLTSQATIDAMMAAAVDRHGRLDGLVNNAGVFAPYMRFEDNSDDEFARMIDINVRPIWRAIKQAKPIMAAQGGGAIVNVASMAAKRANPGLSLYGMTKGAVANMTINAAAEFARAGVRVNAVCPGPIDTDMLGQVESFIDERHSDLARERITSTIPLGRYGSPYEVAAVAAFLLSDDAGFVTGALMHVDGGQSLE